MHNAAVIFRGSPAAAVRPAVHIDGTRAVEPLERRDRHEIDLPETYPTGV
jgi:hypothetical protein